MKGELETEMKNMQDKRRVCRMEKRKMNLEREEGSREHLMYHKICPVALNMTSFAITAFTSIT